MDGTNKEVIRSETPDYNNNWFKFSRDIANMNLSGSMCLVLIKLMNNYCYKENDFWKGFPLQIGAAAMSERIIEKESGLTRPTVAKALDDLSECGLIAQWLDKSGHNSIIAIRSLMTDTVWNNFLKGIINTGFDCSNPSGKIIRPKTTKKQPKKQPKQAEIGGKDSGKEILPICGKDSGKEILPQLYNIQEDNKKNIKKEEEKEPTTCARDFEKSFDDIAKDVCNGAYTQVKFDAVAFVRDLAKSDQVDFYAEIWYGVKYPNKQFADAKQFEKEDCILGVRIALLDYADRCEKDSKFNVPVDKSRTYAAINRWIQTAAKTEKYNDSRANEKRQEKRTAKANKGNLQPTFDEIRDYLQSNYNGWNENHVQTLYNTITSGFWKHTDSDGQKVESSFEKVIAQESKKLGLQKICI